MKIEKSGPLYFAYGSNLASARLKERVPSARILATGRLTGHKLQFHKEGMDGSAKCNAFHTGERGDHVLGALYKIAPAHKERLDRVEGLGVGYEEKSITVITAAGKKMDALTYYATHIDANLKPFHWYKGHVLIGAREHDIPEEYIEQYLSVESIDDPDTERAERELGIHGLGKRDSFGKIGE